MFLAVAAAITAILLGIGAVLGIAIGIAAALIGVAVVVVHTASALGVWRSRPRRKVFFRKRTWALLTVPLGPICAGVYWFLHWVKPCTECCNGCGYARGRNDSWVTCPECGELFPVDHSRAETPVPRA